MNWILRVLGVSANVVILWLLVLSFVINMSAVAGSSIAANESKSIADAHQNFTQAEERYKENVSVVSSGSQGSVLALSTPLVFVDVLWDATHAGLDYGYHNPREGELFGQTFAWLTVVSAAWYSVETLRRRIAR